jgi:hypothetical protein
MSVTQSYARRAVLAPGRCLLVPEQAPQRDAERVRHD